MKKGYLYKKVIYVGKGSKPIFFGESHIRMDTRCPMHDLDIEGVFYYQEKYVGHYNTQHDKVHVHTAFIVFPFERSR
jgi:hypothetical protein